MRNRYLLFGATVIALALAACSSQGVTPSGAPSSVLSPVDHPAERGARYKVIYRFPGGAGGAYPVGGLTFVNGVMFGTTWSGGGASGCTCGTVFAGTKVIYNFKGKAGNDASGPSSGLLPVGDKFYGETGGGGNFSGTCSQDYAQGCGTIYEVDAGGTERVVYRFMGGSDGQFPTGGLISLNGTLYGVTTYGGGVKGCSYSSLPPGCGVIFAIDASGRERVIYRFQGASDGVFPRKALLALDDRLYGTTDSGGSCSDPGGCGTVFRVTTSGNESVIYSFKGGSDGETPGSPLVWHNGTMWGTTVNGGCVSSCRSNGYGTIFKMSTSGHEIIVHRFTDTPDGAHPEAPLAVVGNTIYGTTFSGGGTGHRAGGTIFRVTSNKLTVLHSLNGFSYQRPPALEGLTFDESTKALYGETYQGGSLQVGTIFRYTP